MTSIDPHPYTQVVLDAWRRFADGEADLDQTQAADFPGLVSQLFVLHRIGPSDFCFRHCGDSVQEMFGRDLAEHNFLTLWQNADRALVAAVMDAALLDRGPAVLRAHAETLTGQTAELEIALAPLVTAGAGKARFLGHCLATRDGRRPPYRPFHKIQVSAASPPAARTASPAIRLVASNI